MKDNKMVQSNNAFVRAEQAKIKKMMGDRPVVPHEMRHLDAFMSNDGAHAKKIARNLFKDLDDAYPLK